MSLIQNSFYHYMAPNKSLQPTNPRALRHSVLQLNFLRYTAKIALFFTVSYFLTS